MYVCILLYVYIYIHRYIFIHVQMHVHIESTHTYTCTRTHTFTYTHTYMCTYTHMYILRTHRHIYIYIRIFKHVYIHIYIYPMCISMYVYIYIYSCVDYNFSPTWIKAIWGRFSLLTNDSQWCRNEVVIIYPDIYTKKWYICSSHGTIWKEWPKSSLAQFPPSTFVAYTAARCQPAGVP